MAEVTVIDYGLGNIQAFMHVYDRLNIEAEVASTPDEIARAKRLILPGVRLGSNAAQPIGAARDARRRGAWWQTPRARGMRRHADDG